MKLLGFGGTCIAVRPRFDKADAFRKDGEAVSLKPRNGIIKCEDPKTLLGPDGDLGGVMHVQETLFIRADVNAAIIG